MTTIWKFQIPSGIAPEISMPRGAKILSVQVQGGLPCIWAEVEPKAKLEQRRFLIVGTGHPIEPTGHVEYQRTYVATFQLEGFVWHLFERPIISP